MQAVRARKVVLANALGTGFLQSPALHGFLPALSEHLLGEPFGFALGAHLVVWRSQCLARHSTPFAKSRSFATATQEAAKWCWATS